MYLVQIIQYLDLPFLFHTSFTQGLKPLKITLSCHISGKVQLPKPPLCERSPCQDHYFSAATASLVGGVPYSRSEDSPFRHLPGSHPDHSAAKPEPVRQRCLRTLVPDVVVAKVKKGRRAAFQSLRHDLRQPPHAPVAKDFPRRSQM